MILARVSPVTHSVGNCVKRVVVIVTSVLFFRTPVSPINSLGEFLIAILLMNSQKHPRFSIHLAQLLEQLLTLRSSRKVFEGVWQARNFCCSEKL